MFSDQHEHEQREHEREELHAFGPGGTSYRRGHEFVSDLGSRLQPRGDKAPARGCANQKESQAQHRGQHESGRIGENDLGAPES